jgi:hypothetical protein
VERAAPDQPRSVFDRFAEASSHLAAHRKLDAIAEALADLMHHAADPAASDLRARAGELRRAAGLEDRV